MKIAPIAFLGVPLRVLCPETDEEVRIGLLEHAGLSDDEAMLLGTVPGIHTIGMMFPIDVAWLASDGSLFSVDEDVEPGRRLHALAGPLSALELPGGWFRRHFGPRQTWSFWTRQRETA